MVVGGLKGKVIEGGFEANSFQFVIEVFPPHLELSD